MTDQNVAIRADERMRIGQQLHDSTSQLLAVLQLNLGRMRRQGFDEIEATIAECEEIIVQVGSHIRGLAKAGRS